MVTHSPPLANPLLRTLSEAKFGAMGLLFLICRGLFWFSAAVGIYALFLCIGRMLGPWYALGLVILPFWFTGVALVVRELRSVRGRGLKNHSLYRDRPID